MEEFYSSDLKCMVRRISKAKARKLWEEGFTLYFLSSNMRFDNVWQSPMEDQKNGFSFQGYTFDKICNNYLAYNCDRERGRYIKFYVCHKEIWYRADFDYVPENFGGGCDDYFQLHFSGKKTLAMLDKDAVKTAKEIARQGKYFADAGNVKMDLVQVCEVDGDKECFPEIRTVWH